MNELIDLGLGFWGLLTTVIGGLVSAIVWLIRRRAKLNIFIEQNLEMQKLIAALSYEKIKLITDNTEKHLFLETIRATCPQCYESVLSKLETNTESDEAN